jgi:hypothetical protein
MVLAKLYLVQLCVDELLPYVRMNNKVQNFSFFFLNYLFRKTHR